MQKIEHRILLVGLAISCRQIHIHPTIGIGRIGMIPNRAYLTMCHVLYLILIGRTTAYIENTEHITHITTCEWIDRIDAEDSIYIKTIGKHFRSKWRSGVFPNSVLTLLHSAFSVILFPIGKYPYIFGLWGIQTECHRTIVVHFWRNQFTFTERNILLRAHTH